MFQSFAYSIPLKRPLLLAGGIKLHERKGIVIYNPETAGWGDAAPLPGFSIETIEDVQEAVRQKNWTDPALPSLRFAVDCANKLFQFHPGSVSINGLWIPSMEPLHHFINRISDWEKPVVKVKLGTELDLQPLLDLVYSRPDIRLRLDSNRQWTVEQALKVYGALPKESIDYFEEPLQKAEDYASLWEREPVPVALDEALLKPEGTVLSQQPGVKALVLKPSLLGGIDDWSTWIQWAKQKALTITWSHSFESAVGLWHLVNLARGFGPAGLDTADIFATNLVNPSPKVDRGIIKIGHTILKVSV
jgi:O-succinylbenzoate synthase